jgi:dihydropyrimidine dehydrogenase (NAD+) subunit PreT
MAEIEYALSLGITVTQNFAPKEFLGKNGKVEYAVFKGRDGKSEAKVAADIVIFAIGQKSEDIGALLTGAQTSAKGCIAVRKGGRTSTKGVFAAGDIVTGGKTVVEAVADGKEAAAAVIAYLQKNAKKNTKKGVK